MSRFPRLALLLVLGACERAPRPEAPPAAPPPVAAPAAAIAAPAPALAASAPLPQDPPPAPRRRVAKAKTVASTEPTPRPVAPQLVTPLAQPDLEPIRRTRAGPQWKNTVEPVRVRVVPKAP